MTERERTRCSPLAACCLRTSSRGNVTTPWSWRAPRPGGKQGLPAARRAVQRINIGQRARSSRRASSARTMPASAHASCSSRRRRRTWTRGSTPILCATRRQEKTRGVSSCRATLPSNQRRRSWTRGVHASSRRRTRKRPVPLPRLRRRRPRGSGCAIRRLSQEDGSRARTEGGRRREVCPSHSVCP